MEPQVILEHVEPTPVTVEFEGAPIFLSGDLAAFWKMFAGFYGPEAAADKLSPWLRAEKTEAAKRLQSSAAQILN